MESDTSKTANNVLQLGSEISASSVKVKTGSNSSIILTDGIAGDQITLDSFMNSSTYGVQTVKFADGTAWGRQQLVQMATPPTATLADLQINNLVAGMAAYGVEPAASSQMSYSIEQQPQPMLSARLS